MPIRPALLVAWSALASIGIALGGRSIDLAVYLRAAADVLAGRDPNITPAGELPWLYPPAAALPFAPLTWLPFDLAAVVLALASLAALARTLHLVLGRLGHTSPTATLVAVALAIAVEPVTSTLGHGQVNLVIAWLVAEGFLGGHRWLIGVAAGIKLTPLVFLLPLVLRRDWRGAALTLAGFAGTVAVGWLVAPTASVTYWGGLFFDPRDKIGIAFATNQSITGALWRIAGEGGVPLLGIALSLAVLALAVVAQRRHPDDDVLGLWVTGIAGLLVSPISWTHHWVWLLPAVAWLWVHGRRRFAIAWGVLMVGWVTWWFPDAGGRAFPLDLLAVAVQNSWAIVAVLTLVRCATWRGPSPAATPSGVEPRALEAVR